MPSKTLLDEVHIINNQWFDNLSINDSLQIIESPEKQLKLFYTYTSENIPSKLKYIIDIEKPTYEIEWKKYTSLYIWYDEAQMMKNENLFKIELDTITWLFWNNAIIAWITKKTYTTLDMMHFVPRDFWK